ncbi:hypothetical protein EJ07DRAFT_122537 [Lizonia empirigonia]|nr:hypothetical protein EJ07DRAFT_122537 [Lizonia empirigonia]
MSRFSVKNLIPAAYTLLAAFSYSFLSFLQSYRPGKCGYVWGGMALVCLLPAYFGPPEMKGRSYCELDILFKRKAPARKDKEDEPRQFLLHLERRLLSSSPRIIVPLIMKQIKEQTTNYHRLFSNTLWPIINLFQVEGMRGFQSTATENT